MLDSKLNKGACNLKSVRLYDGSILEFDSRLHGIDIATCLEVPSTFFFRFFIINISNMSKSLLYSLSGLLITRYACEGH